ncbi:hypothetical protein ACSBR1_017615 [Camellia fascicularis]
MLASEMNFKWCPFWVQAHGIPVVKMTKQNVEIIGQRIGNLIGVEAMRDGFYLIIVFCALGLRWTSLNLSLWGNKLGYGSNLRTGRAPKLNMSIAQVQYWVDEVEAHLKAFAKMRALLARRKEVCMGANSPSPGTEQTRMVIPTVSSVKIPIVSGDRVSPPKTGEVHPLRKTGTCGKVDAPSGALVGHLSESTNLEKKVLHGPPFNGPGAGVGPREALAVRRACLMAYALNLSLVEISSDNQSVILSCVSENVPPWDCATIIEDIPRV